MTKSLGLSEAVIWIGIWRLRIGIWDLESKINE